MAACLASGSLRVAESRSREAPPSPLAPLPRHSHPAPSVQLRERLLSGELSNSPGKPSHPTPHCYLPANMQSLWTVLLAEEPQQGGGRQGRTDCLEHPQKMEDSTKQPLLGLAAREARGCLFHGTMRYFPGVPFGMGFTLPSWSATQLSVPRTIGLQWTQ